MNQLEGYCKDCGYPLTGLPSGRCPECGCTFNWSLPTTYSSDREPVQTQSDATQEYRKRLANRIVVSTLVLFSGLVPLLSADRMPGYACCLFIFVIPIWIMLCVIGLLSIVSSTGSLGIPGALLIGIGVGLALGGLTALIATSIGSMGLVFGLPAGLLGAVIFKQLEMNNML